MPQGRECDTIEKKEKGDSAVRKKRCAGIYAKTLAFACLLFAITLNGCVKPTVQPGDTQSPAPKPTLGGNVLTGAVGVTLSPAPTQPTLKGPENTPEPTKPSEPTGLPEISSVPTKEAVPTSEPVLEATPTVKPTPTEAVKEEVPVTQEPLPTGVPDFIALLQNGWQRTEDFFGEREIFFPGWFSQTELLTEEGRYEYRYTAAEDDEVVFSIIGETDTTVQPFLDGLEQAWTDCRITAEGGEDYVYTYTNDSVLVKGRIYACYTEDRSARMRLELQCPADRMQTEGYEFYLK